MDYLYNERNYCPLHSTKSWSKIHLVLGTTICIEFTNNFALPLATADLNFSLQQIKHIVLK